MNKEKFGGSCILVYQKLLIFLPIAEILNFLKLPARILNYAYFLTNIDINLLKNHFISLTYFSGTECNQYLQPKYFIVCNHCKHASVRRHGSFVTYLSFDKVHLLKHPGESRRSARWRCFIATVLE